MSERINPATPLPWKWADQSRRDIKGCLFEGSDSRPVGISRLDDYKDDPDLRYMLHAANKLSELERENARLREALKAMIEPFKFACEVGAPSCDPEQHNLIVAARAALGGAE